MSVYFKCAVIERCKNEETILEKLLFSKRLKISKMFQVFQISNFDVARMISYLLKCFARIFIYFMNTWKHIIYRQTAINIIQSLQ